MTSLLVTVVVAGCGGGDVQDVPSAAPTQTAGEAPTTTSSPGAAADPLARRAVRSGVVALIGADTGKFSVRVPLLGGGSIHEQGSYRVDPVAHDVVREMTGPDGSLRVAYRVVGADAWFRVESAEGSGGATTWPCWVDQSQLSGVAGSVATQLPPPPSGQPPAALVAASYGVGQQTTGARQVEGTTDLALALGLVSDKLLTASGVDPQGDSTVPASFRLTGRTLSGYTIRLADLPGAIRAAGGEASPEVSLLEVESGLLTARFRAVGAPVDIEAPPADRVADVRSAATFEEDLAACGGGRS